MKKLKGEQLDFMGFTTIRTSTLSKDEINDKYSLGEVRIVTEQARYPLVTIKHMVESDTYKLDPDFQRRRRWNRIKQSRLIESFIMNVPIPPIFLYEYEFSKYEVMDGLQRLTAISEFYRDGFPLQDLEEWPELNGLKYSDIPTQVKKGIDRRYLSSIILLHETAKTDEDAAYLKQMVFERINSGGEKLSHQESRNALHNGKFNSLCKTLSAYPAFRNLWGIPSPDNYDYFEEDEIVTEIETDELRTNKYYAKMYDVELVLRFFAYRQGQRSKQKGLKGFLDRYLMATDKAYSDDIRNQLGDLFKRTIDLSVELLGPKAFWMYRKRIGSDTKESWNWRKGATTTMYDCVMQVLSYRLSQSELLIQKASDIQEGMEGFFQENYDTFSGRNVNDPIVRKREQLFNKFISSRIE